MRLFSLSAVSVLSLIASGALAEEYTLESTVSAVTVYPHGAMVTRVVQFDIEAGNHMLTVADLPEDMDFDFLRVAVDGAVLGSTSFRNRALPSQPDRDTAEIVAAREKIERIEVLIQTTQDEAARVRLIADASQARIAFLKQLGSSDNMANASADSLRALVQMVGEETLAARETAFQAQLDAREIETRLVQQREDLAKAQQDLAALVPEVQARSALKINVSSTQASEGTVTIKYVNWAAAWRPAYDVRLTRDDKPNLQIDRIAYVQQFSGENWEDVALTLSTVTPSDQTQPSRVWQRPVRIGSPEPRAVQRLQVESMSDSSPTETTVVVEEAASMVANFDGPAVTYVYDTPVSIASGADAARIMLGSLTADAEVYAHASPAQDATAFMMAEFTNDSGERILPADQASFYIDGALVGVSHVDEIAAGETTALAFGAIPGIQISRTVLNRNEGDRGIISRSNEQTEAVQIEIENLTGESWPVRVFDAVPYSEQEDLVVDWQATPRPTNIDNQNQRGVLRWVLELGAGDSQTIQVTTRLKWPEGQILLQPRPFR